MEDKIHHYQVYFANSLDHPFTYSSVLPNLERKRVLVPLRSKKVIGFVWEETHDIPKVKIKEIEEVVDEEPILDSDQAKLVEWISRQYLSTIGESLTLFFSYSHSILKQNEKKRKEDSEEDSQNLEKQEPQKTLEKINLSEEQEQCFQENKHLLNSFNPFLLHGVTGSGKTFFYLKVIQEIISQGKQALIMVPEISLIFQIIDLCQKVFPADRVAIFHSKLTPKVREDLRVRLRNKQLQVVISTRSGLFLPFKELGVIIIDEEHENSYKNNSTPRYQTKQVSFYWAKLKGIPLFFVSATPSIEIYYQTQIEKIKLIEFKNRFKNYQLPNTLFVRKEANEEISVSTYKKIFNFLENKKQVLIYINQRGFSSTVLCQDCKNYFRCPDCEITLVYHKKKSILICHYCGYKIDFKNQCPDCLGTNLSFIKAGTEKIYEQIKEKFQDYRVQRFDSDIITSPKQINQTLNAFKNHEIDILVGTQMIIKGHDFKNVSLVVVLDPEKYLLLPDYRANERIFSHLIQVSGRAGRHSQEVGEVVIQTEIENHFCLLAAKEQSYDDFYKEEIEYRKVFGYPPFRKIVRFVFRGLVEEQVIEVAKMMKKLLLEKFGSNLSLMGPSPCLLEKQKKYYRWNIIVKVKNFNQFLEQARWIHQQSNRQKKVYIEVDVSPVDLF